VCVCVCESVIATRSDKILTGGRRKKNTNKKRHFITRKVVRNGIKNANAIQKRYEGSNRCPKTNRIIRSRNFGNSFYMKTPFTVASVKTPDRRNMQKDFFGGRPGSAQRIRPAGRGPQSKPRNIAQASRRKLN
jgi:hypothetical protein